MQTGLPLNAAPRAHAPGAVIAYVGIGANLGNAAATVRRAIAALDEIGALDAAAVAAVAAEAQANSTMAAGVNRAGSSTRIAGTRLLQTSPFYSSAPVDAGGDDYVNAVAQISTLLAPLDLLHALQAIEAAFGRERPYRNAPRTLDMDLLLYDDAVLNMPALTVPHPRMTQRAFVLLPLLDIAPDIVIPGYGAARTFLPSLSGQQIRLL